jgi:hypothetical protein
LAIHEAGEVIGRERETVRPNAEDPGFVVGRRGVMFDRGRRRRKLVDFRGSCGTIRARFNGWIQESVIRGLRVFDGGYMEQIEVIGREGEIVRPNSEGPEFAAGRRRVMFDRGRRTRRSVDFRGFVEPFRARFNSWARGSAIRSLGVFAGRYMRRVR